MPKIEGTLFVPKISGSSLFGNPISKAGNWISPPPPAIASTNPAKPEARARKIKTSTLINYLTSVLTTSAKATSTLSDDLRSLISTFPSANDVITYDLTSSTPDFTEVQIIDSVYGTISNCGFNSSSVSRTIGVTYSSNATIDGVTTNYITECP